MLVTNLVFTVIRHVQFLQQVSVQIKEANLKKVVEGRLGVEGGHDSLALAYSWSSFGLDSSALR
jgi:hypothetical protein